MSVGLHLVTGFLGSGKTTFLKNYLKAYGGQRKIAIIQNEFSQVNIDGNELKSAGGNAAGFELLEINNGSVFCVCLLGSFIDSLAAFTDQVKPDVLVMEASGMSDPISLGQIFQSEKLRGKVYLEYTWCIVDALNFDRVKALRNRLEHQIRVADTVVINKLDLVEGNDSPLGEEIRRINPFAHVVETSFARVDFEMKKLPFKVFRLEESTESCRPDLESVVVKTNLEISPAKLDEYILKVKDDLIRMKGYINLPGRKKVMLQSTFGKFTVEEVEWFTGPTEFTGIGEINEKNKYQSLFEEYCNP
jgi:G3E family GTPase